MIKNRVSILVPVFNEAAFIEKSLQAILTKKIAHWGIEVIVVNDGSMDDTGRLLKAVIQSNRSSSKVKVITHRRNKGKGAAILSALKQATGTVILIQDADLEYDPQDYEVLLAAYSDQQTEVVYGSRILGEKLYHSYRSNIFFYWGGIFLTHIVNFFLGTRLTDQPTGFKTWRRTYNSQIRKLCSRTGFDFEIELTALFAKSTTIREVPIHYYPRAVHHGKKITLNDFLKSVVTLVQCAFFPVKS